VDEVPVMSRWKMAGRTRIHAVALDETICLDNVGGLLPLL
jgi:hypothetical protein